MSDDDIPTQAHSNVKPQLSALRVHDFTALITNDQTATYMIITDHQFTFHRFTHFIYNILQ